MNNVINLFDMTPQSPAMPDEETIDSIEYWLLESRNEIRRVADIMEKQSALNPAITKDAMVTVNNLIWIAEAVIGGLIANNATTRTKQ